MHVIVVGGGIAGLCTSMVLAGDGHRVTMLERDPAPPPPAGEAWDRWTRRGVNRFRLLHGFLPRFRYELDRALPGVTGALVADGALRMNRVLALHDSVTGGRRPGDERFDVVTGRRPMMESTLARLTANTFGVDVRRGTGVRGVTTRPGAAGIPHVTGVVTERGDVLGGDLVIDTGGRRSALASWLVAAGARAPRDERDDRGFVYYGRHFRSSDGALPPMFGAPTQPYDSISIVTLPADHGTWGVAIVASARDRALRAARHPDVWSRIVKSYPLVAHWLEGSPLTEIDVMAGIEDHRLDLWVDGAPVATGVAAVGDAWAATNPSNGRGASMPVIHAVALRDTLRGHGDDDPLGLATAWRNATAATVLALFEDTRAFDSHRIREIDARIAGRRYEPEDPGWYAGQALRADAVTDPDLLRAASDLAGLLARPADVFADARVRAKVAAMAQAMPDPLPGPTRAELVALTER